MLDPQDEAYDRRLAKHLVSLYHLTPEEEEEELVVSRSTGQGGLHVSFLRDEGDRNWWYTGGGGREIIVSMTCSCCGEERENTTGAAWPNMEGEPYEHATPFTCIFIHIV